MTAPIILNVRDVALAAQRAYEEGRLSAQGPTPECKYRDKSGLPCAIGAALTDAEARRLDNRKLSCTAIDDHAKAGRVNADDVAALTGLQDAHDSWAAWAADEHEAPVYRKAFLDILSATLSAAEPPSPLTGPERVSAGSERSEAPGGPHA